MDGSISGGENLFAAVLLCCTDGLSMVAGLGRPTPDQVTRVQTNDQGRRTRWTKKQADLCENSMPEPACEEMVFLLFYGARKDHTVPSIPWLRREDEQTKSAAAVEP